MRRILVTAIGGDVGHSVLKCINKDKNHIIGCDLIQYPVGLDLVDEYFITKKATDDDYVEDLLEKLKKYRVTHIIVINEFEINIINENRNRFNDYKLLINSDFIISTFLDKFKTNEYLKSINVGVPKTFRFEEKLPTGQQYILKLNSSSGSKILRIFTNKDEIINIDKLNTNEFIIQEYIDAPDQEYTVGVFSDGEVINTIIFKRVLHGGYTKFVEFSSNKNITTISKRIATAINLRGSLNIQLRELNGEIFIFEINPRLSGTTNFRRKLGFDDVNWWLNSIDGEKVENYEPSFSKAIGIREFNEKFLLIK